MRSRTGAIMLVRIDRSSGMPLSDQIYRAVRSAIDEGRLVAGSELPSSRALSGDLGLARSTVSLAYEHLRREGFIEGAAGRVNRVSADRAPAPRAPAVKRASTEAASQPGRRGQAIAAMSLSGLSPLSKTPRAFRTGLPALDVFPIDLWQRLMSKVWRRTSPQSLGYVDAMGFRPLRSAIADYLRAARGLRCTEEQVMICSGSQQGLDLAVRLTIDRGDAAWLEDPGYIGARLALEANGATLVPVPVDAEGLDVSAGIAAAPDARLAYVTPARQVPLAVALGPARRQQLLAWANSARSWILEDDYDSELRYAAHPIAPLQALDDSDRVILAGTFSKVTLPALRLGYLVLPDALVEPMHRLRYAGDFGTALLNQAVMTRFIVEGHFERHIRRMRTLYRERHDLLTSRLSERLQDLVEITPIDAGMTLPVWLRGGLDERIVAARAADYDLDLMPLSVLSLRPRFRPGLLLGFGGLNNREIEEGVVRLERLLRDVLEETT